MAAEICDSICERKNSRISYRWTRRELPCLRDRRNERKEKKNRHEGDTHIVHDSVRFRHQPGHSGRMDNFTVGTRETGPERPYMHLELVETVAPDALEERIQVVARRKLSDRESFLPALRGPEKVNSLHHLLFP